jgi:thiol-disulfide isomerase/thioredoxin
MDSILPRKYNNPLTIGLGIALVVAVGIIIYLLSKDDKKAEHYSQKPISSGTAMQRPVGASKPVNPELAETHLDESSHPALVLFWGEFCGHSRDFKPEWDKVANILNNGGQIQAIDFENKRDPQIFNAARSKLPEFGGVPDVRFFPDGFDLNKKSVRFNGQRTEEAILKFAYTGK